MKSNILIIVIAFCFISGCEKDPDRIMSPKINELSLYWDHEIFGEEGRRTRFEFYGRDIFENSYELVFEYTINQREISVALVDIIDNGKCPRFPTPLGMDTLCAPIGGFYIPDSILSKGTYSLTITTKDFKITSELIVENDSIIMNIPSNSHLNSSVHTVYPIPLNLLFGSVVYSGAQNGDAVNMFVSDLLKLGLTKASIPNHPYRHLLVDSNGNMEDSSWPPDNYLIGLLYNLNNNFKDEVNLALEYFNKNNINIYLYSSNGDQALLSKLDGIRIVCAD